MLNFVTYDISDQAILENSYNAINRKENLIVVVDELEKTKVFTQTINSLRIDSNCQFSFQNLFKIESQINSFYIAQCLLDYGFPLGSKGSQTFDHKYNYIAIGIANIKIDLGHTYLRPERKIDKLWNHFFNSDIDFEESDKFSDKYYLQSNSKEFIIKHFDKPFLNTIAKYDDVLISIQNNQMYISFENELQSNQCRIIEDIFENSKFVTL